MNDHTKPADGRAELAARWAKAIHDHRTSVRHISQAQLAEELGVTPMAVWQWENGTRIPSDFIKVRLIQMLALDARQLFAPLKAA